MELAITTRAKTAARCGKLRLMVRRIGSELVWTMKGGQWGEHTLREPAPNNRLITHWFGYCRNNGEQPNAQDSWPS